MGTCLSLSFPESDRLKVLECIIHSILNCNSGPGTSSICYDLFSNEILFPAQVTKLFFSVAVQRSSISHYFLFAFQTSFFLYIFGIISLSIVLYDSLSVKKR